MAIATDGSALCVAHRGSRTEAVNGLDLDLLTVTHDPFLARKSKGDHPRPELPVYVAASLDIGSLQSPTYYLDGLIMAVG